MNKALKRNEKGNRAEKDREQSLNKRKSVFEVIGKKSKETNIEERLLENVEIQRLAFYPEPEFDKNGDDT